jgi:hypothetical protein
MARDGACYRVARCANLLLASSDVKRIPEMMLTPYRGEDVTLDTDLASLLKTICHVTCDKSTNQAQ